MKRHFLKTAGFLVTLILITASCAKDDPEPVDPGNPSIPTDPPFFTWTTNGTLTTVADSSHAYVSSNVIFAFKSGYTNSLEIRLSGMGTGTYPVNSVSGNQLEYQLGSTIYTGTGTVNISASTSSKLSGTFTCALSGGTVTGISGSFTDVPKR
jgi:hypothetical protein